MKDLQTKIEKYQLRHINTWVIIFILFFVIVFGAFATGYAQTKQEVYNYCVEIGIKEPEIVTNQSMLETGNLTSKVFKENHNLFGMKRCSVHPLYKKRETTSLGTKNGHAYYSDWKKSVGDYKLWQDRFYKGGDYYEFLIYQGYAKDKNYTDKIKQLCNTH